MILTALDRAGGVGYLTQQAKSNPTAFLSLLAKVLPHEIRTAEAALDPNKDTQRDAAFRVIMAKLDAYAQAPVAPPAPPMIDGAHPITPAIAAGVTLKLR